MPPIGLMLDVLGTQKYVHLHKRLNVIHFLQLFFISYARVIRWIFLQDETVTSNSQSLF